MSVVDIVGWIAALSSASLAVPQGARIAMTRSVAGVSTITWQTMLIAGVAWTAHGLLYGTQQIIWPNALLGITSAWVLWQLTAAHRLPVVRTWSIPMAYAALAFAADLTIGPLAFAAVMLVPGIMGQISQLREIVRVPDPSGVSMVALVSNLVNQVLWLSYALPIHEVAVVGVSTPMVFIVAASIVALAVKRRRYAASRVESRRAEPVGHIAAHSIPDTAKSVAAPIVVAAPVAVAAMSGASAVGAPSVPVPVAESVDR